MKAIIKTSTIVLFAFFVSLGSQSSHSQTGIITAGFAIDKATEAIDEIIDKAFSSIDLTLLKGAMEARSTIDSAAENLEGVVDHSFDRLDQQQKKLVEDLMAFSRMWSTNSVKLLEEIRTEKYMIVSDVRMIFSDEPGAIRIIPSYTIEGENRFDFRILGSSLSNLKPEKVRLNGKAVSFSLVDQHDGGAKLRIKFSGNFTSNLVKRNNGRYADAKLTFEVHEKLLGIKTDTRRYSSLGYIIPKKVGTAQIKYTISKRVTEYGKTVRSEERETGRAKKSKTSRKRSSKTEPFNIKARSGWKLDRKSIKAFFTKPLESGCSNGNSSIRVTKISANGREATILMTATTDKGYGSKYCRVYGAAKYREYRAKEIKKPVFKEVELFVGKDRDIPMDGKNPELQSVLIKSNLSKGEFSIKQEETRGGIKLELSPNRKSVILKSTYSYNM